MVTKVTLDELPAGLAEQIRELRDPIEITDRDRTVARIVPPSSESEYVHRAPLGRRLGDYVPTPIAEAGIDLLDALYEDRRKDRNR